MVHYTNAEIAVMNSLYLQAFIRKDILIVPYQMVDFFSETRSFHEGKSEGRPGTVQKLEIGETVLQEMKEPLSFSG